MVTAATSFGRNGVSDWLIQRFTAVVLAAYCLFMAAFFILHPDLTYEQWRGLFSHLWMRIFTLLTLASIVAHGWIGLWVILTDYVTSRMIGAPALALRMLILSLYAVVNVVFLVWGVEILWGY